MGSQETKYWLRHSGHGYPHATTDPTPLRRAIITIVHGGGYRGPSMPSQKKRILIVDDSATARMWQQLLLSHEQYVTLVAQDGAEGVEIARRERPDLILLDVSMPTMDGFAACRALRAAPETRDIPILMVTTHSEMENVLAGFEAGCNEYITKPLERSEYLVKVRSYLNRHLGDAE
jgi:CheY-like chemotaxis protein